MTRPAKWALAPAIVLLPSFGCSDANDAKSAAPTVEAPFAPIPSVARPPVAGRPSDRLAPAFASCFRDPGSCDDGNDCTVDTCHPLLGCRYKQKAPGAACDDGDACTNADACTTEGSCRGEPVSCEDDNPCTADSCTQSTGACAHDVLPGLSCDDADACTGEDVCDETGACSGTQLVVDDDNECTVDSCHSQSGVRNDPVSAGTACDGDGAGEWLCDGQGVCSRLIDAESVVDRVGGFDPSVRERVLGAGRHPVNAVGAHVGVTFVEHLASGEARVAAASLSAGGAGLGLWRSGPTAIESDPVIAATPSGLVVVYADVGLDGDGLGIGMQLLSLDASPVGPPLIANQTTVFGQHSPDVLWDGASLVVAWEDDSMGNSWERRVCQRRFAVDGAALGPELCKGGPDGHLSNPVVAATTKGLAWTWRKETLESCTYELSWGSTAWTLSVEGYPPSGEVPALAELDADHLLVVYVDGAEQLMATVVNATSGPTGAFVLNPGGPSRWEPSLATTADGVYLSWRERTSVPAVQADDVRMQRGAWDVGQLTWSPSVLPIPYPDTWCTGDQGRAALVAVQMVPSGAMAAVWNDRVARLGRPEHGDVLLSIMRTPVVRPVEM